MTSYEILEEEVISLTRELKSLTDLYHNQGTGECDEYDFIRLRRNRILRYLLKLNPNAIVKILEGNSNLSLHDLLIDAIGTPPPPDATHHRHKVLFTSLRHIETRQEVYALLKYIAKQTNILGGTIEYVCEPKIDGIAVALLYENGELIKAATRGDGAVGEDITESLLFYPSIRKHLDTQGHASLPTNVELRGELFLDRGAFRKLNERLYRLGSSPFLTPKNATIVLSRNCDSVRRLEHLPKFACYSVLADGELNFTTYEQSMKYVESLGVQSVPRRKIYRTKESVWNYCVRLLAEKDELPFEIDGAVVKLNDMTLQREIGSEVRYPLAAFAYKPSTPMKMEVVGIRASVTERGNLFFKVVLEKREKEESGKQYFSTKLSKKEIVEHDLDIGTIVYATVGGIGDEILSLERRRIFQMPTRCPACYGPLINGASTNCCPNENCPSKLKAKFRQLPLFELEEETRNLLTSSKAQPSGALSQNRL